ncbi:Rv1733c family protein [Streptomyces sp. NPDC002386]
MPAKTPRPDKSRVLLWRWRHNALRRHSDIVEAWIVLGIWLLVVVGGAVAGLVAARTVESDFAARRARAHAVAAVVTDVTPATPPTASGRDDGRVWVTVRWTDADGSVHQDKAKVLPGAPAGTRLTVWADNADRVVPEPLGRTAAAVQADLTGILFGPLAAGAIWAGGHLLRAVLVRRRLTEWDEEWKRVGPEWRNLSGGRG